MLAKERSGAENKDTNWYSGTANGVSLLWGTEGKEQMKTHEHSTSFLKGAGTNRKVIETDPRVTGSDEYRQVFDRVQPGLLVLDRLLLVFKKTECSFSSWI